MGWPVRFHRPRRSGGPAVAAGHIGLVMLVATPIVNGMSRHIEHEADRFGLEITRDNHAAASAFIKRNNEAMGVPYPGWLETHLPPGPSVAGRPDHLRQ